MTGNVLRRLREAYGISSVELAKFAELSHHSVLLNIEKRCSYVKGSKQNTKRRVSWLRILNALRKATGREHKPVVPVVPVVEVAASWAQPVPKGTTHFLAGEPVRIREYGGKRMGFAWVGEWVRSSRVEDAKRLEAV